MTTSIEQFAQRILFGRSLEDKLYQPEQLIYSLHRAFSKPTKPGRPASLQFSKKKLSFPKNFDRNENRAQALLFFANHELLAIEIMALCLLRFPDAPIAFRKGIAHTISEEQLHLQMYIQRASALGLELGEVPVNSFFWDCLSGMDDPMDFVIGMGLTFEQANLDHCLYYMNLFEQVGDTETVSLLKQVYRDEIRHVRHGLRWFRKWKPPEEADFYAHESRLKLPMSPARAKGAFFDTQGRQEAGLSNEYIRQLQVYSKSKGRPSNVYLFRPHCELHQLGANVQPKASGQKMEEALAPLMLFLCKKDDLVVSSSPSTEQLIALQKGGVVLPQFVSSLRQLQDRQIGEYRPWGWSSRIASEIGVPWNEGWQKLYGKSWGRDCLRCYLEQFPADYLGGEETIGKTCHSLEEGMEHITQLQKKGYHRVVIKAEWGTAGRSALRAETEQQENTIRWLRNILRKQGSVVIEPELDRVVDYSIQITVSEKVNINAVGRFETDQRGQYLGHHLGAFHKGLPRDILRFVHGDGRDPRLWHRVVQQTAQLVGMALQQEGYRGPAGIDAMIYRVGEKYKIRPIVEVNPRYTMGRIAAEISKHISSGQSAYFGIAPTKNITPVAMKYQKGRFHKGVLQLTDPKYPFSAFLQVGID